jgi:hypothetical protein
LDAESQVSAADKLITGRAGGSETEDEDEDEDEVRMRMRARMRMMRVRTRASPKRGER